jgi:hypothetical protein
MKYRKHLLILGIPILLAGAAAFLAGRLLNSEFGWNGNAAPISIQILPAVELPAARSDVIGAFIERRDNIIIVATQSQDGNGPQVEILVTGNTIIYRETTQLDKPLTVENQDIQQTVEESNLDHLGPQSTLAVWGRRSGDRIVADMLLYSDRAMIKRMLFQDCDICP